MSGLHPQCAGVQFSQQQRASGTLHSDLRLFLIRKQHKPPKDLQHFVKKLGLWFYLLSIPGAGGFV